MTSLEKLLLIQVSGKLVDKAEFAMAAAEDADKQAEAALGGQKVRLLEERDRHLNRAKAFMEAATIVKEAL